MHYHSCSKEAMDPGSDLRYQCLRYFVKNIGIEFGSFEDLSLDRRWGSGPTNFQCMRFAPYPPPTKTHRYALLIRFLKSYKSYSIGALRFLRYATVKLMFLNTSALGNSPCARQHFWLRLHKSAILKRALPMMHHRHCKKHSRWHLPSPSLG